MVATPAMKKRSSKFSQNVEKRGNVKKSLRKPEKKTWTWVIVFFAVVMFGSIVVELWNSGLFK